MTVCWHVQAYYKNKHERELALLRRQCGENLELLEHVLQVSKPRDTADAILGILCFATRQQACLKLKRHHYAARPAVACRSILPRL
jgi:hypothetical protein